MSLTSKDELIVIVAPIEPDAAAMAELLSAEGFETQIYEFGELLLTGFTDGPGMLVLTEEALESPHASDFLKTLRAQPSWSELPIIILTSGGESRRTSLLDLAAGAAGAVTLLERPVSRRTLIRSVQVALRSRRRQYQIRELLHELKSLNETLEQRVAQRSSEAIERAERLRILSGELTYAEETERRRIAEILHDDLQQMLVAARMQCLVLNKATEAGKRRETAREIEDLLDRSFNLTRSLIVELAPPVLHEYGLAAALESLGTQTKNHHHMHITVRADSSANPKDPSLNIFLFRAVRELLLNAVKHTNGSPVRVTMTRLRPNNVQIIIADKGPGFDPDKLNWRHIKPSGFGLFNIRERLANFGGELRIESIPGRGSRMTLIAPRNSVRKRPSRLKARSSFDHTFTVHSQPTALHK